VLVSTAMPSMTSSSMVQTTRGFGWTLKMSRKLFTGFPIWNSFMGDTKMPLGHWSTVSVKYLVKVEGIRW